MRTADFDYDLPPAFIAQRPADPRDSSRLMVLHRTDGRIEHRIFHELPEILRPEDLLVLNQTRVIPARLQAEKIDTGGRAELLLLQRLNDRRWKALVGGRGLRPGRRLRLSNGLKVEVATDLGGAIRELIFSQPVSQAIERIGEMPLPPYIRTPLRNPNEYQTVYAAVAGSAAAPTAGLHFTPALLAMLQEMGIRLAFVTLHIGLDTFAPVTAEDPSRHSIHTEWCQVPPDVVQAVQETTDGAGRVIAVGTTSVRALETAARAAVGGARIGVFEGPTDLYILPGARFAAVDGMLTNFHLPRSTLLMMVSAFAGRENILGAYELAMREGYRFYSFGDAMLLL